MWSTLKSYAPAIAIGLILVIFIVGRFVVQPLLKQRPEAPAPVATAPAETAKPGAAIPVTPPPVAVVETTPTPAPSPATPPPPTSPPPVSTEWPTYHGGGDLCGYSEVNFPQQPQQRWSYAAEGNALTPVGDAAAIYVATATGVVASLDHAGKERWRKTLTRAADGGEKNERIEAPIAVFHGTVFIGSTSGVLYALAADTGEPRWRFDVPGGVLGSVAFDPPRDANDAARVIVVQREDGVVHSLNAATGEKVWQTDAFARCDGSPAIAENTLVWGACDSLFHIHSAREGIRQHTVAPGGECQIASGPAIAGGDFYSGTRCGKFMRVRISDGQVIWTNTDSTKEIFTTPALSKDLAIFGSDDGYLYAVDRATGAQRWKHDLSGAPSSPVIVGDQVAVAVDGTLHLLKLADGTAIWSHEVADHISSPAVIGGQLIVGSEDGTITAFGEAPSP